MVAVIEHIFVGFALRDLVIWAKLRLSDAEI